MHTVALTSQAPGACKHMLPSVRAILFEATHKCNGVVRSCGCDHSSTTRAARPPSPGCRSNVPLYRLPPDESS